MDYLIEKTLPAHQVHILAGASGSGKTDFLFQYLREFIDGKPFFGRPVHPVPLLYITTDRSLAEYEEKFALRDIDPLPIASILSNRTYSPADLTKPGKRIVLLSRILDTYRKQVPDVGLLALDTISSLLGSKINDYGAVLEALTELNRWVEDEHITLLGTHHATKLKPDTNFARLQDRILGSGALQGYTGTQLFLTSTQESKSGNVILTINPHNHPPDSIELTREPNGRFRQVESPEEAADQLMFFGVPKPPDSLSVQELLVLNPSLSQATLYRRLHILEQSDQIIKLDHGRYQRRVIT